MKKIFSFLPYIFFFFTVLFFHLILNPINFDEIWSFGFTNNIYMGLLPYKDFNMILTPFYPFLMSFAFFIFGNNIVVFHIENALLCTILLYLIFSLIKQKGFLLLPFFVLPYSISFPNYNFFLLFLFVFLLCAEEWKWKDFIIGLFIGIIFLTKQSVGFLLLFSIFYYWKDYPKIIKRFLGFLLPCFIFLFYLIFTKSFSEFLDLCFLGLLDFGSGNGSISPIFFSLFLLLTGLSIFFWWREKNISYFYLLLFGSIVIPLFDLYHFLIYFFAFLIVFLKNKSDIKLQPRLVGGIFFVFFTFFSFLQISFDGKYPNDVNHFEYRFLSNEMISFTKKVNQYMDEHKDHEFVFLSIDAYYFRLIRDEKITYLDLINYGNHGYHGSAKLINLVKEKQDAYFLIASNGSYKSGQIDMGVVEYVKENGEKIDEVSVFDVYVLSSKTPL